MNHLVFVKKHLLMYFTITEFDFNKVLIPQNPQFIFMGIFSYRQILMNSIVHQNLIAIQ